MQISGTIIPVLNIFGKRYSTKLNLVLLNPNRGRAFIWDHLDMKDIECYWEKLLKRYAKLMNWKPKRKRNMMQIKPKVHDEL